MGGTGLGIIRSALPHPHLLHFSLVPQLLASLALCGTLTPFSPYLGPYLCKKLCKIFGGTVWAERGDTGSVLHFTVNLEGMCAPGVPPIGLLPASASYCSLPLHPSANRGRQRTRRTVGRGQACAMACAVVLPRPSHLAPPPGSTVPRGRHRDGGQQPRRVHATPTNQEDKEECHRRQAQRCASSL
jgi:hypothetical protein